MNLRELCRTSSGLFLRPFAPNANWQTAEVFVVGTNPARPVGPEDCDYDQFMHSLMGDGELFRAIYGVRGISKTRARTNELLQGIAANVLVTNVYWTPTARDRELRASQKNSSLFRALVRYVKPRVIVAHGKPAAKVLGVDVAKPLAEQDWTMELPDAPYATRVFAYPHFSGVGWPKGFKSQHDDMALLAARIMAEFGPETDKKLTSNGAGFEG